MFDGVRQRLAMTLAVGCALACAGPVTAATATTSHRAARKPAHPVPYRVIHHDAHSARPFATALNVALAGSATASTEAAGSPASNAIDGDASTQWCSAQWTGNVTVDLGSVRVLNGFGLTLGSGATTALVNISAGDRPQCAHAGPGPPAADAGGQHARVLAAARHAAGALREDRRDRQRRHPAVHRGVPRVLADVVERHPRPRRRPLLRAPGGGRGRAVQRRRGPGHGAVDPQPSRPQLRPPAPVGGPVARLQQPGLRPEDGPADQGRRRQALPGHPLLGLLG